MTTKPLLKILNLESNLLDVWQLLATEDEHRWRKSSRAITEDGWLAMIDKIHSGAVMIQVACIVWWDYVPIDKPWPKFDRYLDAWKPDQRAGKEATRQALMDIGYPERLATEHCKVMK